MSPGQHDPGQRGGARGADERRAYGNLRMIFDEACRVTAPFFDPTQGWGGSSLTLYARQTLRETYPNLSQQEIAILFSAVQRHHRTPANK